MKRVLAVIVCVALCLAGCSHPISPATESTPLPTASPSVGYLGGDQVDFALDWESTNDVKKWLCLPDHYEIISIVHGDYMGDDSQDIAVLYGEGDRTLGIERFNLTIIDGGDNSVRYQEIATDFVHGPCLYTVGGPDKKDAILAVFDSGGSGGVRKYFIFDAEYGQIIDMFNQESRELHPAGVLIDGFKGSVYIERTDQTFEFSIESHKDLYTKDAGLYNNDGTLRHPDYEIFFDDIYTMNCEEVGGKQVFTCAQLGSAWGHQDTVCAVYSQYGYGADGEIVLEKVWLESLAEAASKSRQ